MINKNRLIFWILIILVIINLTALSAYFFSIRKTSVVNPPSQVYRRGAALEKELSLNPDQTTRVAKINETYRTQSEPILSSIRSKKAELLDELSNAESDSLKISTLADDVIAEQKKLQQINIRQFLDLKEVCTPEQTQRLSQIYSELYGCQRNGQGRGQGMQGQGHRHRYGWQARDTTGSK